MSSKEILKIVGFNQDIVWENPEENLEKISSVFKDIVADVFVLPEMFTTGFCMKSVGNLNQGVLLWMQDFAKSKNAAIVGSVAFEENENLYNRMYFVKPDGSHDFYDKRHLFSFAGEDKFYKSGGNRKIVNYKGVRILLQICYDLRFPVFSRNRQDYDLIINVANWPETRVDAWEALLKARAIENQAYVFGLNRVGEDANNLKYCRSSHCFFADGKKISIDEEDLTYASIDIEELEAYQNKFQFLKDADDFEIII